MNTDEFRSSINHQDAQVIFVVVVDIGSLSKGIVLNLLHVENVNLSCDWNSNLIYIIIICKIEQK